MTPTPKWSTKMTVIAVLVGIVIVGGIVYALSFSTSTKSGVTVSESPLSSNEIYSQSESEILGSLKTNWQSTQALIAFRPSYHNQAENAGKVWRGPNAVQFIGKNKVLVRFEDDNNSHVAAFDFDGSKFNLLEVFKNQDGFTLSDWQNLVKKYGDASYSASTYTKDLIRNREIVSFPDLTKVSENIFVKNYWEQYPNDTVSPTPTSQAQTTSEIYLALISETPVNGAPMIGCGEYVVYRKFLLFPLTNSPPLAATYQTLFLYTQAYVNEWTTYWERKTYIHEIANQTNLKFDKVTVTNGVALVYLTGSLISNECADPRVAAQIEYTAKYFPNVQKVEVYLNGTLFDLNAWASAGKNQ